MKSSSERYGTVATLIHWTSVALILALFALGAIASDTENVQVKLTLLRLHVPLGLVIFLLTLFRIVWWWKFDEKPKSLPMPIWQDRFARAVHVLFYIVILGMSMSGIGMLILSNAGSVIFGGAAAASLPDFWEYAPRVPHGIGAKVMICLFVLHAGAALFHQFYMKDGLLRRMWL